MKYMKNMLDPRNLSFEFIHVFEMNQTLYKKNSNFDHSIKTRPF